MFLTLGVNISHLLLSDTPKFNGLNYLADPVGQEPQTPWLGVLATGV